MGKTLDELMATLPDKQRAEAERRATQLIAEEMARRAMLEEDHKDGPRERDEKADRETT